MCFELNSSLFLLFIIIIISFLFPKNLVVCCEQKFKIFCFAPSFIKMQKILLTNGGDYASKVNPNYDHLT